jgi:hypothetical protein
MNQESTGHGIHAITREIADWCDTQATKFSNDASHQFRLIIAIVVAGLGLLLILPPLIGQIDFMTTSMFGGAPPSEVVKEAEGAVVRLRQQVGKSRARVVDLETGLAKVRKQLDQHASNRIRLVRDAQKTFGAPLARWKIFDAAKDKNVHLQTMAVGSRGLAIAAGYEGTLRNNRITIMWSTNQRNWRIYYPKARGNRAISGALHAATYGPNGTVIVAGHEGSETAGDRKLLVLRSGSGTNWTSIYPLGNDGKRIAGTIYALAGTVANGMWAAGTEPVGKLERKIVILHSRGGGSWRRIKVTDSSGNELNGIIWTLIRGPGDSVIAGGYEGDLNRRRLLLLTSNDGETWSVWRPKTSDGKHIAGEVRSLAAAPNGSVIAGGYELVQRRYFPVLFRSKDGKEWKMTRYPTPSITNTRSSLNRIEAVAATRFGTLAALGSTNVGLYLVGKGHWNPVVLEDPNGGRLRTRVETLAVAPDGSILMAGANAQIYAYHQKFLPPRKWEDWSVKASWKKQSLLIDEAFEGLRDWLVGDDVVFVKGAARLRRRYADTRSAWDRDREAEPRLANLLKDANAALHEQESTLQQVEKATKQLSTALIDADELRRASRIATRVAVVALLIYLVQIVVNRYRYLQRISGFYRARAQAFRFLAASPNLGDELLKNVTVTDLMAGLSPDGIGFDKSAEPPTQNLVNFIREAIRRERPG